jgi:hypothetical protein
MTIEITRMTEDDIDGAIDTIQQAFANDPYNNWVYPDRSKVCDFYLRSNPICHGAEKSMMARFLLVGNKAKKLKLCDLMPRLG